MGFEDSALARLRRYREEAGRSLEVQRGIEETTRRFSGRLFGGLEYVASLGRQAGIRMELERAKDVLVLRVEVAKLPGAEASFTLGLVASVVAAKTDEDLMHEDLSRYSLDPRRDTPVASSAGRRRQEKSPARPSLCMGRARGRRKAPSSPKPAGE